MYVYAAVLYVMVLSCIEMFERLKTKAVSAGAYYTMGVGICGGEKICG